MILRPFAGIGITGKSGRCSWLETSPVAAGSAVSSIAGTPAGENAGPLGLLPTSLTACQPPPRNIPSGHRLSSWKQESGCSGDGLLDCSVGGCDQLVQPWMPGKELLSRTTTPCFLRGPSSSPSPWPDLLFGHDAVTSQVLCCSLAARSLVGTVWINLSAKGYGTMSLRVISGSRRGKSPRFAFVLVIWARTCSSRPARGNSPSRSEIPRDLQGSSFISLQGDFLSEHDVSRCKIISGHEAPTEDWLAVIVQFSNV